ncbi:DUF4145 domain-containing protein [Streptomyces virginiae]|uniref:DUF4145 domain-containing protein n=1 Tax=Streptomyces virginiae TaxID=1961 RepID=UPI0035D63B0D
MTSKPLNPRRASAAGYCPNCRTHSNFQRLQVEYVWPRHLHDLREVANYGDKHKRWVMESVHECQYCRKTVLTQLVEWHGKDGRSIEEVRQIWPMREARELVDSAPAAMRDLFLEGGRCEAAGAYRAAGAMYRAAVEELCRDRGAAGKALYDKIEDLVNRGVTREVVDDLHEARSLGNWSLHDGLEFSAEEVADVAELITEAVHIVYVEPAERKKMREARKARRDAFKAGAP